MKNLLFILCFVLMGCQTTESVSHTGTDINENQRVCEEPKGDLICTAIFGPGDQFAEDCKVQGHVAIQCGCHDWICKK